MHVIEMRVEILDRPIAEFSCLLGTLVQEVYASHPALLAASDGAMSAHIDELVEDIAAARALYAPDAEWSPESLGYFIQAALQGSFIYAKAKSGPDVARSDLAHLKRYLETLFPTGK